MPFHKKTYMNGSLIIQFKIKFPNKMDPKACEMAKTALTGTFKGKKEEKKTNEKVEETVEMQDYKEFHRNAHHGGGDKGNDSEEEDGDDQPGGQRIGC